MSHFVAIILLPQDFRDIHAISPIPALTLTVNAIQKTGLTCDIRWFSDGSMGDALARAVEIHQNAAGWLVFPGCFPLLKASTIRTISRYIARDNSVIPKYKGEYGYPIGFGSKCRQKIYSFHSNVDIHGVARKLPLTEISLNDIGITLPVPPSFGAKELEALIAMREADSSQSKSILGLEINLST